MFEAIDFSAFGRKYLGIYLTYWEIAKFIVEQVVNKEITKNILLFPSI